MNFQWTSQVVEIEGQWKICALLKGSVGHLVHYENEESKEWCKEWAPSEYHKGRLQVGGIDFQSGFFSYG